MNSRRRLGDMVCEPSTCRPQRVDGASCHWAPLPPLYADALAHHRRPRLSHAGLRRGSRRACCTAPSPCFCSTLRTSCCCSSGRPPRSRSPASGPTPAAPTRCTATAQPVRVHAWGVHAGWAGGRAGGGLAADVTCAVHPLAEVASGAASNPEGAHPAQHSPSHRFALPPHLTPHRPYTCVPTEVDGAADVATGGAPGAKRAAVRKLLHELGIPSAQLPLEQFKFLTRLHYCAADTGGCRCSVGADAAYGCHPVDIHPLLASPRSL